MSLLASDPQYAKAAQAIENMPPAEALQYLAQHNLPSALAVGILEQAQLKKHAAQQQKLQQAQAALQGQPQTALDSTREQFKQAMNQYASDASGAGLANLSVPNNMFSQHGMKAGGIVAFSEGDMVQAEEQADYQPALTETYYSNLINQQNAMRQQQAAQAQKQAAAPVAAAAKGGSVKKFAAGGDNNQGYYPKENPYDLGNPNYGKDMSKNAGEGLDPVFMMKNFPDQFQQSMAELGKDMPPKPTDPSKFPGGNTMPERRPVGFAPFANVGPTVNLKGEPNGSPAAIPSKDAAQAAAPTPPPVAPTDGAARPGSAQDPIGMAMRFYNKTEQDTRNYQKEYVKSPDEHFDEIQAINDRNGIGQAAQQHKDYINNQLGNLSKLQGQDKWLALAQAGFAMADAATRNPHGGFLGALAVGGTEGAKDYISSLKEYRKAKDDYNTQLYNVQQSQENLKYDSSKRAFDEAEKDKTNFFNYLGRLDTAQSRLVSALSTREYANMNSAAIRASRPVNPQAEAYKAYAAKYGEVEGWQRMQQDAAAAQAASMKAGESLEQARERISSNLMTGNMNFQKDFAAWQNEQDETKKKQWQNKLEQYIQAAQGKFDNSLWSPPTVISNATTGK